MNHLSVRLRVDFGPGRALGPGKIDLLESIGRTGSLSAAAAALEMSYKRAWDLLQSLNELYERPMVTMSKGGRGGGGGPALTERGRDVIAAFRAAESQCARVAAEAFAELLPVTPRAGRRHPVRRLGPARKAR